MPAKRPGPRRRDTRLLAAATIIPALIAAAIVIGLTAGDGSGDDQATARQPAAPRVTKADLLARQAESEVKVDTTRLRKRPGKPVTLSVPSLGIQAPVEPVGVDSSGVLRIPDVGRAGWYSGGPRPGERGRTVIVGHIDTGRGPALFSKVPTLKGGAAIDVIDKRGRPHRYRVIGGAQVRKSRFPTDAVYGRSEQPVLVLVTCGGPYITGQGFRDNIIVYARARTQT